MDSVDIVQSVSGLSPHTLFRAMHSEGMLMLNLHAMPVGLCPSILIDIQS